MIIIGELGNCLELFESSAKSIENLSDVGTLLHGDDSKLILLIDPGKESFGIVVVNTSVLWPVSVETTGFKESITLLEEEVILDELL